MRYIIKIIGDLNLIKPSKEFSIYEKIKLSLNKKEKLLKEQLSLVNKKVFLAEEVFDLNKKYDLKDN